MTQQPAPVPPQRTADRVVGALLSVLLLCIGGFLGILGWMDIGLEAANCSTSRCRSAGTDLLTVAIVLVPVLPGVGSLVWLARRARRGAPAWWVPLVCALPLLLYPAVLRDVVDAWVAR